jgi:hypothetical protein
MVDFTQSFEAQYADCPDRAYGLVAAIVGACITCKCATRWKEVTIDQYVCSEGCLDEYVDKISTISWTDPANNSRVTRT